MNRYLCLFLVLLLWGSYSYSDTWIPLTTTFHAFSDEADRKVGYTETLNGNDLSIDVFVPGFFAKELRENLRPFTKLTLPGEAYDGIIGDPKIPVIRKLIKVPNGGKLKVKRFYGNYEETSMIYYGLIGDIVPVQPSPSKSSTSKPKFQMNRLKYFTNAYLKNRGYRLGREVYIKGEKHQYIEIYPIKYNPFRRNLKIATDIKFELTVQGGSIETKSLKKETSQNGLLFIIADELMENEKLVEFINWKKQLGFKVKVLPVSELGEDSKQIRASLLEEYKLWEAPKLDYIIIVGDVEMVPAHWGKSYAKQATDNFYATLDTVNYGEDISTPDLHIGRLSVNNEEELEIVLGKLLKYERADFESIDWLKKLAFIATSDRGWFKVAEGTFNHIIENYTGGRGYIGNFPELQAQGGDKLYAITHKAESEDVMTALHSGRSIVNYSGHGLQDMWEGPHVNFSDVRSLEHKDATPYVISHACLTGSYARPKKDSFAEVWLKAPRGAIGFLGASNSSYWPEDDTMGKEMWRTLIEDSEYRVGNINLAGLEKVRTSFNNSNKVPYYFEIYNLMGDPTLALFTEVPKKLSVKVPAIIHGASAFQVKVFDKEGPVKNANVFVQDERSEDGFFVKTGVDGVARFRINTNLDKPETMKVTVSAFNYVPKTIEVPVIIEENSFFAVESVHFDGDSKLTPFQSFKMRFKLKNVGKLAGSPKLKIRELHKGLRYLGSDRNGCDNLYLEPGAIGECEGTYEFFLDKVYENGKHLSFSMISEKEGVENELNILLPVSSPKLDVEEVLFEEITGNANGFVDPGEHIDMLVKIKNSGEAVSYDADTVLLSDLHPCLEQLSIFSSFIKPLKPGESDTVRFNLLVGEDCQVGTQASYSLKTKTSRDPSFVYFSKDYSQVVGTKRTLTFSGNAITPIPDGDRIGTDKKFDVEGKIKISQVRVYVDIKHPYINDITIDLKSPDDTLVKLRKRSGGANDDIEGWFGEDLIPEESLDKLIGLNGNGTWTLNIADHANRDEGSLENWTVEVHGFAN